MDETLVASSDELMAVPPDISHLITEDDTPVDNLFSEKQMRLLTESLYSAWPGPGNGRTFVVMANVGLFYTVHAPAIVPDVLLSVDVSLPEEVFQKEHRSYFIWEYGKPPDVVVEVVSNRKGGELGDKLLDYARLGIAYYVVFDPDLRLSERRLRIFTRQGAHYVETAETWFPEVELGIAEWEGDYEDAPAIWLRWRNAQGVLIATGKEAAMQARQDAEQAEQRAEQAEQRAAHAEQRARQAEEYAAHLTARLRDMGANPDE